VFFFPGGRESPARLGNQIATFDVVKRSARGETMASLFKRFPVAEKNLLKIFCSNRNVQLQVVNNRTGHIFLWASTLEKELSQSLRTTWDKQAARQCAALLARRARAANHQQITWERHNSFRGQHCREGRKLPITGKVKVVIDTLLAHGMEFVQYANKRPPKHPWDKAPRSPPAPPREIGEMPR
jgi:ribosomal protein L18